MNYGKDFKISAKQWRGYFAMHSESFGPSANDNYNIDKYGITHEQYYSLLKIAEDAAGMDAKQLTKKQIEKLLQGERVFSSYAHPDLILRAMRAFQ